MMSKSCIGGMCGAACMMQATIPAAIGQANDVPLAVPISPFVLITAASLPRVIMSGLMRPSALFPRDEKGARLLSMSTAPTDRTSLASAGTQILRHWLLPSLPALMMVAMPFSTAICAEREHGAVLPSRSSWVRFFVVSSNWV